jgi:hypothetical protein
MRHACPIGNGVDNTSPQESIKAVAVGGPLSKLWMIRWYDRIHDLGTSLCQKPTFGQRRQPKWRREGDDADRREAYVNPSLGSNSACEWIVTKAVGSARASLETNIEHAPKADYENGRDYHVGERAILSNDCVFEQL